MDKAQIALEYLIVIKDLNFNLNFIVLFLREFSHRDNLLTSYSRGIFSPLFLGFNCISSLPLE